ncbi:hypothetical protein Tsubulata_049053 [Turnera subulata]|uniref:RING-type domain-containing protein n=1 Tax=Turnera subulata TaxID=218843 RepID=A0A9Q0FZJ8_9ROSI|nr:hypothetical protein Tsubulata_049053 [Turnera subulata]
MIRCLDLIFSHLKWALNFFQTYQILVPEVGTEIDISYHTKASQSTGEPTECAVCLCKVEEGEEIRELRCNHIFHRVCLDRWIGYRHSTCPLCRESIFPRRTVTGLGAELLVFKFCAFSDDEGGDRWWLR